MRLGWTPAAADDLESIRNYLALHLPTFTQSTILEIYQAILTLRSTPFRGRVGREEGTRELVLPRLPYIVVYRVKEDDVEILHIVHGAQHRP
ncbi:MAG: type II toxin-antitoxin system RelE/ParE family toxin [Terracidiphilus sp.]